MQFSELVATSAAVVGVSGRLEKIARFVELLVRLPPDDIEIAVAFLAGSPGQGRIGVGYSAIASASSIPPGRFPELARALWEQTVGRFIRRLAAYFTTRAVKALLVITDAEAAADVFLSLVIGLTPILAEMNSPSADADGWIKKRARDRVQAFLKIYARRVDASQQEPQRKPTQPGDAVSRRTYARTRQGRIVDPQ